MLDAGFIRENLAAVKANCVNRNVDVDVDVVVQLDDDRKKLQRLADETKAKQNEVSKKFSGAKTPEEKDAVKVESIQLKERVAEYDEQLKKVKAHLIAALQTIPNMTHPAAPVGADPSFNKIVAEFGKKPTFDFKAKDHYDLIHELDLADLEAGARVAGQRFYFLKNEGALLELALVQYAMSTLVKEGFTPVITPDLARVEVLEGIGFMPRDNAETRQVYTIADTDLCLIATAEITLGGMHKDQVFDEADLPRKYVGLSHCFRTEAGAAGRDTRGLYRVHQFTKVEMFAFCTPDQSEAIHEEIRAIEEKIFNDLGIPFHVIDTCTGDLGGPAYRKYDLEAWMPGRGNGGDYGEITSTSNCTDFQARRLGIRYRPKEKKAGLPFVYTLNGTAIASTRAMIAILENYQQADGSVVIPEVLRPWIGKDVIAAQGEEVSLFSRRPQGAVTRVAVVYFSRHLSEFPMNLLERITVNPEIYGGKPIIRGRRLAVEHVLEMLAVGDTVEEILGGYPWLELADIQACLMYASRTVGGDQHMPFMAEAS